MRVKNLRLFIHREQKSLKTQYEINIFASKFHLGASWCPPGRVGAPWAYFGLQYCLKMGVLGSSWAHFGVILGHFWSSKVTRKVF